MLENKHPAAGSQIQLQFVNDIQYGKSKNTNIKKKKKT